MRRIQIPGVSVHVIRRGINRCTIFGDRSDFELFLVLLEMAAGDHDVSVHSYILMNNHYHLIATPNRSEALARMMRDVGREYVKRFNRRYDRIGTLYNGRYRNIPITDEQYLLTCMRYIEHNPVRAGMVSAPEDYKWSTFRVHAFGEPSRWLVPHLAYLALGRTPADRQTAYRALCEPELPESDLIRQRHGLRRKHPDAVSSNESEPRSGHNLIAT